jgi:hypothetical protein
MERGCGRTVVLYGREASQWLMPGARGEPGRYHPRNEYMWGWRESAAQGCLQGVWVCDDDDH